jgi:hypothetical protein
MPRRRVPWFLLGLLCGCGAPAADDGAAVGYVLFDRDARAALALRDGDLTFAPLLPVELEASTTLTVVGGDEPAPLALRPGTLAHVRGAEGRVEERAIGPDVRADRLLLHATEAGARALAERLAADLSARGDGLWSLSAEDLFARTSFLDVPDGVLEALPDTSLDLAAPDLFAGDSPQAIFAAPAELAEDGAVGVEIARAEAALVGLYGGGLVSLLLDASGGFTQWDRCTGAVTLEGRYHLVGGGDRVLLQPTAGAPIALARRGEALTHAGGAVLAPAFSEATFDTMGDAP